MNFKISIIACIIFFVTGCKKNENKCVAGNGGSVTLVVYPKHHGKSVRPYTAYIKFNTKDAPSSISNYDVTKTADTTEDHIELTNLKCGNYYIYVNGYDTTISEHVKGGVPYTISEGASGEVSVDIPVTE